MYSFFKKERLLLTLIILFGLFFGILGAILKYTAYRNRNIHAPAIAFGFLAMHDGVLSDGPILVQVPKPEAEADTEAAAAPEAEAESSEAAEEVPEEEAEPEGPVFQHVNKRYFSDALFIGDSRTDGLRLFAPFEGADYFCDTGMSVLECLDTAAEVEGVGTVTLEQLLAQKEYGKIYISLGINDVGYDFDYLAENYGEVYDFLRKNAPDAIIYIMASMHVAKNRALNEPIFESENVNELNRRFSEYADGVHSFYIDENEVFDDEEGYLIADYTGDNVHLYAKYYELWDEFLCDNAVVTPDMKNTGEAPAASEDGSESGGQEDAPTFREVDENYFSDALFIGDARVDGLRLYAPFGGADYFCTTDMTLTDCLEEKVAVDGMGETTLLQLLSHRAYGKIYISLGINEMGYDLDYLINQFDSIYNALREAKPDAVIYIMANLHVTKSYADSETYFQSDRVDELNRRFSEYADGVHSFYIDENAVFDDTDGYLAEKYTGDDVHPLAKYYALWKDFLCKNAAVPAGAAAAGDEGSDVAEEVPEE